MKSVKLLVVISFLLSASLKAQDEASLENQTDTVLKEKFVPQYSTSLGVIDEETDNQDVSGLLQSSKDVFTSIAGYNLSAGRYRVRGYDSENFSVMMNGISLNNPESGRAIWAFWGGLNDITRYQESKNGISSNQYGFGAIGGFSNIDARASSQRKGSRISYANSNRSYQHRVMFTHSTGMMDNGLAVTVSGSIRYATEGYVEGTFYRAGSYFLSVEKKINEKHSLGFVGYGAPTVQGRQSITTQETYDLTGNNNYNAYWGYQNGEKRNSRVRNNHIPMMMLNHYFTINAKTKLTTSAFYSFGRSGNTRLNWQDAADPRPEYYKNLPSYYDNPEDQSLFDYYTEAWQNDVNTQQINWDQMYFANTKNLHTVQNVGGVEGVNVTGNRAKYIVEEQRNDQTRYGFNSVINHELDEGVQLSGGLMMSNYKSKNFQVVNDLLGADYWLNVNQLAARGLTTTAEQALQNDINEPNRIIKQGEKFGYDYDMYINTQNAFAQIEGVSSKIDYYTGVSFSRTATWREGNVENGLFLDRSVGKSEKLTFLNPGIKGGIVYKITGRHLVAINGALMSRAPVTQNTFLSPRTRNQVNKSVVNETVASGDINYMIRYPKLKVRATVFLTTITDKTRVINTYDDVLNTFGNYIIKGVDQRFLGSEIGVEYNVTSTIIATAAFSKGDYTYTSNPLVDYVQDNISSFLITNKRVFLKNYKVGGIPQTAASLGLKYNSTKYWFVGVNANYFVDAYLDVSPERKSATATATFVSTDPQYQKLIEQEKLDPGFTLDLFAGKSWRLKNKYYLRLNVNVNNVLDKKDYQTGGFEQIRLDVQNVDKFPPRVGYMYGRTYFAMVSFNF
ncbi:MAG: TonB-dependent receptor plug domain-containing protein [Flavobacteriales bacterium]|nr:TonB-dependent receptor plug domain-containing protein [Flavobacteriales bacterium]MCB9363659.1 TonB-dependent receptor plug domain-containing protein [Flavobacteriales bacterium]